MEVLEDQDQRSLLGERLEEAPPGRGASLGLVAARLGARLRGPASGRRWPSTHGASPSSSRTLLDGRAKLGLGRLGVVALQDPGLRLGHLAQRPESDSVAVWQ